MDKDFIQVKLISEPCWSQEAILPFMTNLSSYTTLSKHHIKYEL